MARHGVMLQGVKLPSLLGLDPLTDLTAADDQLEDLLKIFWGASPVKGPLKNFPRFVLPGVGEIMDFLEELGKQLSGNADFSLCPQTVSMPGKS